MSQAHIYRLKFTEGEPQRPDIEFEATDAYKALVAARDRAYHHPAELWRDGERLCTIRRVEGEVWEIRPVERVFEPQMD